MNSMEMEERERIVSRSPEELFHQYHRETIKYWEFRRLIYNAWLVFPSCLGLWFTYQLSEPVELVDFKLLSFVFSLCVLMVGANIAYSFVYAIEFWFLLANKPTAWISSGRRIIFASGCVIATGLSVLGGAWLGEIGFGPIIF